ncbi:MAG: DegV family EDD domain-containing protein [Polyangiaceae bacterium]|nr:DegV family EDD domain-containing protein [Polyangiaceae bacterium]
MADGLNPTELLGLRAGYHRLREHAGLLDAINVFPVADADTGQNLVASLAPLERDYPSSAELARALLWSALGNSGNIGVGFLQGLLEQPDLPLAERFTRGATLARAAVAEPRPGTMLTVLERLLEAADRFGIGREGFPSVAATLAEAVAETTARMKLLADCGVVDSGALGLFVFLEEYLGVLTDCPVRTDVAKRFRGRLAILHPAAEARDSDHGSCIDAMVEVAKVEPELLAAIRGLGDSVVVVQSHHLLKIHLHSDDPERLRHELGALGRLLRFDTSALVPEARHCAGRTLSGRAKLVTDAAGSLSREVAESLGVELLESYVNLPDGSGPETQVDRNAVWSALRAGSRVTTAQAPIAQRHQRFAALLERHERVVYVCVGSVFTGNYAAAAEWARRQGVENRFLVLDSGVASGRLAVVVRRLAELAELGRPLDHAAETERLLSRADELIFIDTLEYLARGGRLNRASAWFGGLLGLKPVITPTPQGARRVAMAKSFEGQLEHARRRLQALPDRGRGLVLLQYTDNEELVRERVLPVLREAASEARIEVGPLSLTTAVHTGPGTWAVAFLPLLTDPEATPCS